MAAGPSMELDPLDVQRTRASVLERMFGVAATPVQIDRFVIESTAGQGAMGRVYVARDPELERRVALKMITVDAGDDELEARSRRLEDEAQAMARLAHPNVVEVYAVGRVDAGVYIAMEYVPGETLAGWIARGPYSFADAWPKLLAAGRGLEAAHAAGIVHRDFKPSNVLLGGAETVKVADFGLATQRSAMRTDRASGGQVTESGDSGAAGTPRFLAPEVWAGQRATPRSDQYAFCIVARDALDPERTPAAALQAIERGLAESPSDRFESMGALLDALAADRRLARWPWVAGAGLLALAGWMATLEAETSGCGDIAAELDGIWDDATQGEIESAVLGSDVSYAEQLWPALRERIDRYAAEWTSAREATCHAIAQGGASPERDRAGACLADRLRALAAVTETLADADGTVLARTTQLMEGLVPADVCRLAETGMDSVPPPRDPELAATVDEIRGQLARSAAMRRAGRYAQALDAADRALESAKEAGYEPVISEAKQVVALARDATADYEGAAALLEEAHAEALARGQDMLALSTAIDLVYVIGDRLGRRDDAQTWQRFAQAYLERAGRERTPVGAELSSNVGVVAFRAGNFAEAKRIHAEVLALRTEMYPDGDPKVAETLTNLGLAEDRLGELAAGAEHHQRALEIIGNALGTEHPQYAELLENMAANQSSRGEFAASRASLERVLKIFRETLGENHPKVAGVLTSIGLAYLDAGDYPSALDHMRRGLALEREAYGAEHARVAATMLNLGVIEHFAGEHQTALERLEAAERLLRAAHGDEHPYVGMALSNQGLALRELGRYEESAARLGRAVEIAKAAHGTDHITYAAALDDFGTTQMVAGNFEEALEHQRAALEIFEKLESGPLSLTLVYTHVGSSLAGLGRHAEALERYQQALVAAEGLEETHEDRAYIHLRIAGVKLAQGDASAAVDAAERALRTGETMSEGRRAEAHLLLAQALCASSGELQRAQVSIAAAKALGADAAAARAACL